MASFNTMFQNVKLARQKKKSGGQTIGCDESPSLITEGHGKVNPAVVNPREPNQVPTLKDVFGPDSGKWKEISTDKIPLDIADKYGNMAVRPKKKEEKKHQPVQYWRPENMEREPSPLPSKTTLIPSPLPLMNAWEGKDGHQLFQDSSRASSLSSGEMEDMKTALRMSLTTEKEDARRRKAHYANMFGNPDAYCQVACKPSKTYDEPIETEDRANNKSSEDWDAEAIIVRAKLEATSKMAKATPKMHVPYIPPGLPPRMQKQNALEMKRREDRAVQWTSKSTTPLPKPKTAHSPEIPPSLLPSKELPEFERSVQKSQIVESADVSPSLTAQVPIRVPLPYLPRQEVSIIIPKTKLPTSSSAPNEDFNLDDFIGSRSSGNPERSVSPTDFFVSKAVKEPLVANVKQDVTNFLSPDQLHKLSEAVKKFPVVNEQIVTSLIDVMFPEVVQKVRAHAQANLLAQASQTFASYAAEGANNNVPFSPAQFLVTSRLHQQPSHSPVSPTNSLMSSLSPTQNHYAVPQFLVPAGNHDFLSLSPSMGQSCPPFMYPVSSANIMAQQQLYMSHLSYSRQLAANSEFTHMPNVPLYGAPTFSVIPRENL